jgi:LPXTG-site transpeptidase (sortase) family protein
MIATAITAAIVAVVIAAAATLLLSTPPVTTAAGSAAATAAATPAPPSEVAEQEPSPDAEPPPAPSAPKVPTSSARLEDVNAAQEPTPVGLSSEKIGVSGAPIDPVGIESNGTMEIPTDISRIGWYEYGPSPGKQPGSAVLTAHIDSRTQGKGVFYHLDAMAAGDTVDVEMSDGTTRTFVVDEVRQIPKVDLPTGDLFRRDGAPQLALITCGGEFDASSRHYRDNLVVLATPAG